MANILVNELKELKKEKGLTWSYIAYKADMNVSTLNCKLCINEQNKLTISDYQKIKQVIENA